MSMKISNFSENLDFDESMLSPTSVEITIEHQSEIRKINYIGILSIFRIVLLHWGRMSNLDVPLSVLAVVG